MSPVDEATEVGSDALSLSIHEAAALYDLLRISAPPALRSMLPADIAETDSALVSLVVHRGLLARGLIGIDSDDTVLVDDAVVGLLRLVAMPALAVRVEVEDDGALVVRTAYAMPDVAVVETVDGSGVLTYEPLDPADLLEFVVDSSQLDARPVLGPVHDFTVPLGVLASAGEALAEGDADTALHALAEAGVSKDDAQAYVDALLQHRVGARGVTTVHRVDDVLTTTTTAWTDCAQSGLWLSEQPDAETVYAPTQPDHVSPDVMDSPIHLRRVSGDEVLQLLQAGFPGGSESLHRPE